MEDIIQLKITLRYTKPPIWRRVLVEKTTTFEKLHHIIQIAMGWANSHLYDFYFSDIIITKQNDEFDDHFNHKILDAETLTLENMIHNIKQKFDYVYDMGDNWEHQITVEKFLPRDPQTKYPICIGGKLNCPPEDCGGIPGYYHILEVMNNKRHPDRKSIIEWLGGLYDPEYFDKKLVNEQLEDIDT